MQKILIDSGPLIALFDASDSYHTKSVEFIKHNSCVLVTSLASVTETLHLLNFSKDAQTDFLSWLHAGAVEIEPIDNYDLLDIKNMMTKYADLPMDFADACLVFLGNKLRIDNVATIDRDFNIYRLQGERSFTTWIK